MEMQAEKLLGPMPSRVNCCVLIHSFIHKHQLSSYYEPCQR